MAKRKTPTDPMTEAEWLAEADPVAMVAFLRGQPRAPLRVWRLFLSTYWNWQAQNLGSPEDQKKLRERAGLLAEWAESGKKPSGVTDPEQALFIGFNRSPAAAATTTVRWGHGHGSVASATQRAFLREMFGNPFRPAALDHAWLTDTVLALARGIYAERAFDRMPILADALQDAGCENDDMLSHCRDDKQVHVRGCWVVDLLLGKV